MINKNKTAIITGGLGGIGIEITKLFYKRKYNIIIVDNKINSAFKKVIFNKTNAKNTILYKKVDLSNRKSIKNLFINLKNQYSKIDVLINCAGIQHVDPVESFPDTKWEQILNVNLSSSFYTSKYVLPLMKKNKWGRIINISSVHGQVASINKSAYVASKHGMIGLTKTIALETAKIPITCNVICPGWVNTLLVSKQITQRAKKNNTSKMKEEFKLLKEKQPNLSFIKGKDIASLAYFLCSEEANDITGSTINIDGGWTSQ